MKNVREIINDYVSRMPYVGGVLTAEIRPKEACLGLASLVLVGGCATTEIIYSKYGDTIRKYDARGNRVEVLQDLDRDGIQDRTWTYEYDDQGNKTKLTLDDHGHVRVWTWEYDAQGNKVKETQDNDHDGNPDLVWKLERVQRWDFDGDGVTDRTDPYVPDGR